MDKKPFDHFEDRFQQAAENVSPPFNEKGWDKMQVLLDKEFQKDRRPFIAVWWPLMLLLLLGSGGAIYYYQNDRSLKDKKTESAQLDKTINKVDQEQKLKQGNATGNDKENKTIEALNQENNKSSNLNPKNNEGISPKQPNQVNKNLYQQPAGGTRNFAKPGRPGIGKPNSRDNLTNASKAGESSKDATVIDNNDETGAVTDDNPTGKINQTVPQAAPLQNDSSTGVTGFKTNIPAGSDSIRISVIKEKTSTTKKDKVPTRVYFTASVAPDGIGIKKIELNNFANVFGVGIGYRLNKRLSLQSGVYAGRRIYEAGPGDYNAKTGSYIDTVDIIKIDANCYIIDIPVSLRYDLVQKKKFNVYSVAGLSTFIMKKESYDYHYRYRYNGMYHQYASTYTGNKHFFSVADLSIGFEYKLTNAFFIQAEPYVKVPLAGVGEGKVKLYSAGLQFGIKYQPLKKKNGN